MHTAESPAVTGAPQPIDTPQGVSTDVEVDAENATSVALTKSPTANGVAARRATPPAGDSMEPFVTVAEAIAAATAARESWAHTTPLQKAHLLEKSLKLLAKEHRLLTDASLERRGYLADVKGAADLEPARAQAVACENAVIPMMSSLLLATWMHNMRACLVSMGYSGTFPAPTKSFDNYDGSFRHVVGPIDTLSWLVSGTAALEIYTAPLAEGQRSHQREFTARNNSSVSEPTAEPQEQQSVQQSDKSEDELPKDERRSDHQLRPQEGTGKSDVVLVLGAGNYDGPVDLLTAMLVDNSVVIYKFSELSEGLAAPLARIFRPFLDSGVLSFVRGGPAVATELLQHETVNRWTLTGDKRTAYKILFGQPEPPSGDEQEAIAKLVMRKPFVAELGCCTPYFVCPGSWTPSELTYHARHLAFNLLLNGGHVCVHPQVILTCRNWPQRKAFLAAVRANLNSAYSGGMFYPGADASMKALLDSLVTFGPISESQVQDFLIEGSWSGSSRLFFGQDLDPSRDGWPLFKQEAFCPVSGEFPLDTEPTISAFLPEAVAFANSKLKGTLAATIIAKCVSSADSEAVDHGIVDLQYGAVGLNTNANIAILFPQLVWGGFEKRGVHFGNLESGIGKFGNCYGFVQPTKSVVRSPFTVSTALYTQFWPKNAGSARKLRKLLDRVVAGLCNASPAQGLFSRLRNWVGIAGGAMGI